jgi:hypothetical protein
MPNADPASSRRVGRRASCFWMTSRSDSIAAKSVRTRVGGRSQINFRGPRSREPKEVVAMVRCVFVRTILDQGGEPRTTRSTTNRASVGLDRRAARARSREAVPAQLCRNSEPSTSTISGRFGACPPKSRPGFGRKCKTERGRRAIAFRPCYGSEPSLINQYTEVSPRLKCRRRVDPKQGQHAWR